MGNNQKFRGTKPMQVLVFNFAYQFRLRERTTWIKSHILAQFPGRTSPFCNSSGDLQRDLSYVVHIGYIKNPCRGSASFYRKLHNITGSN